MKFLILLIVISCAVPLKRTKYTDPVMRIMLDPDSIQEDHHARIQMALVSSGKWQVIDRARGLEAVKKEQENLHRNDPDRFENEQKYAHWGKLYGVGGIVIAHAQCQLKSTFWGGKVYELCLQHLSIVNANTSEVLAAVEHMQEGDVRTTGIAPTWNDAVDKLNMAFPARFESKIEQPLLDYQNASKFNGERQERLRYPGKAQSPQNALSGPDKSTLAEDSKKR